MATSEERINRLEAHVQEHSLGFHTLRESISRLEQRLDTRIDNLEHRMEARFEGVDRRLDMVITMLVGLFLAIISGFATTFLTR